MINGLGTRPQTQAERIENFRPDYWAWVRDFLVCLSTLNTWADGSPSEERIEKEVYVGFC